MHGLKKSKVAKFHARMEIRLRSGRTEKTSRFLGKDMRVERLKGVEEKQKENMNWSNGINYFW